MDSENSTAQPPFSSCAVARCIMNKHNDVKIPFMGITKLVKLVYIAHGFYLGKYRDPLIVETVEAWRFGPALRDLYVKIKEEEKEKVDFKDILSASVEEASTIEKNTKVMNIINEVVEIYNKFDAFKLTDITHKIGTPWEITKRNTDLLIDDALIQEYYAEKLSPQ